MLTALFAGGKDIGDYIGRQHNWEATSSPKRRENCTGIRFYQRYGHISINTLKEYYPSAIRMYRLPSSERIFIDAIQACAVVKAIDSQIDSLEFHMQALKDKALGSRIWLGRYSRQSTRVLCIPLVWGRNHLSSGGCGVEQRGIYGQSEESIDKSERALKQECRKLY